MARKWQALEAARDVLRSIDGTNGYNTNFEGRVYSRVFEPPAQTSESLPYVCLALNQETERLEHDGQSAESKYQLLGHAFFSDDPESDPVNSSGAVEAAKFRDDVIRAFMLDPTLGGTVHYCLVDAVDTYSGNLASPVCRVTFNLEIVQIIGAADLTAA